MLSCAEEVAGTRTPGKASGDGYPLARLARRVVVALADRQLKVKRLRLRHEQEGEVKVPAYRKPCKTTAPRLSRA